MLRLDADVRNADWVKTRTWDLPTTLEELLVTIGGKSGIPRLLASPVAEAMPPALRAQVTATTMTLPALKAYRADLQRLLGGFLQVDEKLRHVRDADFWGAPVGTPLPLNKPSQTPTGMSLYDGPKESRVTFDDSREWNDAYREYHDLPYLDKFTDDQLTLTLDQYIAGREPKRDPVPEEMQAKIEDVINGLVDDFPKILTVNDVESVRVTFSAGDEHQELAHAAGNPPRITVSTDLFVDPDALIKSLHDADHDMPGIILHSQAVRDGDADAVLRSAITHEFGHILDQAARRSPKAYREILDLADDTTAQWAPEDARSRYVGPRRWEVDPLIVDGVGLSGYWGGNFHSMYATENRHEWIAEAFADGYLNGDTASDAGKAVLAYFQKVFG